MAKIFQFLRIGFKKHTLRWKWGAIERGSYFSIQKSNVEATFWGGQTWWKRLFVKIAVDPERRQPINITLLRWLLHSFPRLISFTSNHARQNPTQRLEAAASQIQGRRCRRCQRPYLPKTSQEALASRWYHPQHRWVPRVHHQCDGGKCPASADPSHDCGWLFQEKDCFRETCASRPSKHLSWLRHQTTSAWFEQLRKK